VTGGQELQVVRFDVEEEAECRTGLLLAVGAVAGVDEERGGNQAVADGVAHAAACYGGEGPVGWF